MESKIKVEGYINCEELVKMIQEQGVIIQKQGDKIDRLQDQLYQLYGGLFNQRKQSGTLDRAVANLYSMAPEVGHKDDPTYYKQFPTTRQGDELEKRMNELSGDIFCLQFAVTELGASIFNQETQKNSWIEMRKLIRPKDEYEDVPPDTSKWDTPTTRQGDENERRIDALEEKLAKFAKLFSDK
jgi:uncharacterized coiled-coil protein SlyX